MAPHTWSTISWTLIGAGSAALAFCLGQECNPLPGFRPENAHPASVSTVKLQIRII